LVELFVAKKTLFFFARSASIAAFAPGISASPFQTTPSQSMTTLSTSSSSSLVSPSREVTRTRCRCFESAASVRTASARPRGVGARRDAAKRARRRGARVETRDARASDAECGARARVLECGDRGGNRLMGIYTL